jgi:hypothetical protein
MNEMEWITNVPPTEEVSLSGMVIGYTSRGYISICSWEYVAEYWKDEVMAWMPIPKPSPPKKWRVKWNHDFHSWALYEDINGHVHLLFFSGIPEEAVEAAKRIEDIYNEVVP